MTRISGHEKRMREAIMQARIRKAAPKLLEALEFVMSRSRGTSGRIIIELHEEDKIISAIKAAKGE